MHVWPVKLPQCFYIPNINDGSEKTYDSQDNVGNEPVLQTIEFSHSNIMMLLTPTRILAYSIKPICLISYHERSFNSLDNFGINDFMTANIVKCNFINNLSLKTDQQRDYESNEKLYCYVVTKKNCILVYSVKSNLTPRMTFKEYGIPVSNLPNFYVEDGTKSKEVTSSEILTIYDKSNNHRIIQNGYYVDKQENFFQRFALGSELCDELPVKKLNLSLKVVLKFDHKIEDIIAVCCNDNHDSIFEGNLYILFPHGLQILSLSSLQLQDTSLIAVSNGKKITLCQEKIVILSQDNDGSLIINFIDVKNKNVTSKLIPDKIMDPVIQCFYHANKLIIGFEFGLLYYDLSEYCIIDKWIPGYKIKRCDEINNDTLCLLSIDSEINIITTWGNVLFTASISEITNCGDKHFTFTDFVYINNCLVIVTDSGSFYQWDLWEEQINSATYHCDGSLIFKNGNDIMIYSRKNDTSNSMVEFYTINLPTNSINNYISLMKINETASLFSIFVANKSILLLYLLNYDSWINFLDVNIINMEWLGSNYLLCHIVSDNSVQQLKCYHFPLKITLDSVLDDYLVWTWDIPSDFIISRMFVITLNKFRLLKTKSKEHDYDEQFYKIGEIILTSLSDAGCILFDVIATLHPSGINIIRKIPQLDHGNLPTIYTSAITWMLPYKNGFLASKNGCMIKINKHEDNLWCTATLLSKLEKIIQVMQDTISVIDGNELLIFKIDSLWNNLPPMVRLPITEDGYPIAISIGSAIIHNIHCIWGQNLITLSVNYSIYLDQIIEYMIGVGNSNELINGKYSHLKHYKFALEKILSSNVLKNHSLNKIFELIDIYDKQKELSGDDQESSVKLSIIINCLRKIEVEHWNYLFTSLELSPRVLLKKCIEEGKTKLLGALLMVLLNYNESPVDKRTETRCSSKKKHKKTSKKSKKKTNQKYNDSIGSDMTRLNDTELIIQVLEIFISKASICTVASDAQEYWDMSFQLIRFLNALDGGSELIRKYLDIL